MEQTYATEQRTRGAADALLQAARSTIAYYKALAPERTCLFDENSPCGGLWHWSGTMACPLCSARAAIAQAEGRA